MPSVDVTGLLRKWSQGDGADELTPLVYSELRRSTELVHEAYLRLIEAVDGQGPASLFTQPREVGLAKSFSSEASCP